MPIGKKALNNAWTQTHKHTHRLSLFIRAAGGCFVTDWPNVLYANHFDADLLFN